MKRKSLPGSIVLFLILATFTYSGYAQYGQYTVRGNQYQTSSYSLSIKDVHNDRLSSGCGNVDVLNKNESREIEWSTSFGGELFDECYASCQTSDGGYAMIGRTNSAGSGHFDAWLVRTDQSGTKLWDKYYGDEYIDEAYMIKETSDGGFIITGMSTKFGWAGEGWLIKTDNSGTIIWEHGYHPTVGSLEVAWDYIYDVNETVDGGFVFAGSAPTVEENIQAWIGKVDANGTLLWDHTYGLEYWERIFSLQPTSDGGYIGVGDRHWTYNDTLFHHDGWMLKFNETGDTVWTRHFGQVGHDIFRSVKQTNDGGYIIAGESEAGTSISWYGWIVRTDQNGNELWNQHLSKGGLFGVLCNTDNSFTFAGIIPNNVSAGDGWILNVNESGTINWQANIIGTEVDDIFLSINHTSDGGLICSGKYNQIAERADYWLVKMDSNGPDALSFFFEDFDDVNPPSLPDKWSSLKDVMLANTAAEIRTMNMGSTTSLPNALFLMNGINGSNGQIDTTAFVSLLSPLVMIGDLGAKVKFNATGNVPIQIGLMTDPFNIETFQLVEEISIDANYLEYSVFFSTVGNYYIAFKHSNLAAVNPIFLDDISFEQSTVGIKDISHSDIMLYPNPAGQSVNIISNESLVSVKIYNVTGQQVFNNSSISDKSTVIDLSHFQTGAYLVKTETRSGNTMTKKLLIR